MRWLGIVVAGAGCIGGLEAADTRTSRINAPGAPLFEAETRAYAMPVDQYSYEKYQLTQEDDLEAAFVKLILLQRCLDFGNPDFDINDCLRVFMENAELAHGKFPDSVPVTVIFCNAKYFLPGAEGRLMQL